MQTEGIFNALIEYIRKNVSTPVRAFEFCSLKFLRPSAIA